MDSKTLDKAFGTARSPCCNAHIIPTVELDGSKGKVCRECKKSVSMDKTATSSERICIRDGQVMEPHEKGIWCNNCKEAVGGDFCKDCGLCKCPRVGKGSEECPDRVEPHCICKEDPASPQYKKLCESLSLFCQAKGLDEKSKDQLATLVAMAVRIGESGREQLLEACKRVLPFLDFCENSNTNKVRTHLQVAIAKASALSA